MSAETTTTEQAVEQPQVQGPRNVFEALIQVRAACPYIQKNKQMKGGGSYMYASIDGYLEQVKPEFDKAGICIFPVGSDVVSRERVEVGSNKNLMFLTVLRVKYMVSHAPSNTSLPQPVEVLGEATDTLDKSVPKCFTMALKQLIRQILQVETGEEERGAISAASVATTASRSESYIVACTTLRGCKTSTALESTWRRCEKSDFSKDELESLKQIRNEMVGRVKHDPAEACANDPRPNRNGNGQRRPQPSR